MKNLKKKWLIFLFQLSFFIEKKIGFIVLFFLVTRRSLSGGFTANKKNSKKNNKKNQ